jgi:hypothetical protein
MVIKLETVEYSKNKKNNWEYWTNSQAQNFSAKDKQICDFCLSKFYYDKEVYWATITDLKKRQQIESISMMEPLWLSLVALIN